MITAFRYVFGAAAVLMAGATLCMILMEERPLAGPARRRRRWRSRAPTAQCSAVSANAAHQVPGLETSVSLLVMNSSSTGMPSLVFSMPRLMAGMMSSGLVTRSP